MMYNYSNWWPGMGFGVGVGAFALLLLIWSFLWKGLALWHSAQRKQSWWFLAFLVINTAGILELIYLFGIAKVKSDELFK